MGNPALGYKLPFMHWSEKTNRYPPRCLLAILLVFHASLLQAQDESPFASAKALKELSIEELMNIEVTLVSRSPVKLTDVPSAIQVITREDILRSGATNLPDALRLVSNLQVAQLNANAWIISARGFNTLFANKLLVMIDGRTVYTPLFGGVLWELQNVLLEDVDRIEVVSGPGGTLWGANAVNGVINIVTRSARETRGTYVSVLHGTSLKDAEGVRHGGKIADNLYYRVYGQHFNRNGISLSDEGGNTDAWYLSQLGFRIDWQPSKKESVTFQGDFYAGKRNTDPKSFFDGQNVLVRWKHTFSEKSNFIVQAYADRYWIDDSTSLGDQMQTVDIDLQHQFRLASRHQLLWGIDFRAVSDHVVQRAGVAGLLPPRKKLDVASAFIQDAISLSKKTRVTVGTKVLHNVYTGFEVQPSLRFSVKPNDHNLAWAAISRAIRAPSRFDVDYYLPTYPVPPESPSVAGGPDFVSEKLMAYEAGYRLQPNERSTLSLAGFYNVYRDLYSVEALPGTLTYQIQNGSEGESWGGEFAGTYQLSDRWRMRAGYTYFDKDLRASRGRDFDPSYLGNDSRNNAFFQSILNMGERLELDVIGRYLDYLPKTLATAEVPEYFTFDVRLAYRWKFLELSLIGQNLREKEHAEFGSLKIARSVYGRIACRF